MSNNTTSLTLILATLVVASLMAAHHHFREEVAVAERIEAGAHARASAVQAQHRVLECVKMPAHYHSREWCILFRTPN